MSCLLIQHLSIVFWGSLNTLPVIRDYPHFITYFVQRDFHLKFTQHSIPGHLPCRGLNLLQPQKLCSSKVRDETTHCSAVMTGVKTRVMRLKFWVRIFGIQIQLCDLTAVWPQAGHLTSLSFCSLLCKMWIKIMLPNRDGMRIRWDKVHSTLSAAPGKEESLNKSQVYFLLLYAVLEEVYRE